MLPQSILRGKERPRRTLVVPLGKFISCDVSVFASVFFSVLFLNCSYPAHSGAAYFSLPVPDEHI